MTQHTWQQLNELTEQALRLDIILPLLQRTPGVEGISDIHGKNEAGLDIIFFTRDAVRTTCCGIQLKRGNIGGGAKASGTAQEIIRQLQLARKIKHPVAIGSYAGKHRVERFIVATSGNITEGARREIGEALEEISVDFWDGHEITRRVRDHFPQLLTGVDAATVDYLVDLVAAYDRLDALDQLKVVSKRALSDIFVEPLLRRKFASTVSGSPAPAHAATESAGAKVQAPRPLGVSVPVAPVALLRARHPSMIIADQNEGKTSLIRMLAIRRANIILSGEVPDAEDALPVLLQARDILSAASVEIAIEEAAVRLNGQALVSTVSTRLKVGGWTVFLDGFSELPTEDQKAACEQLVLSFHNRYQHVLIIGTGRPSDFLEPRYFTSFQHYSINAFTDSQVAALTRKYAKGIANTQDVANAMVRRVKDALQLPGSPIPAIIGVMVYDEEKRYITNTAEAVDAFMTIRLGRYAREMGIKQEVDWSRKQDLLAEVAFYMVEEGLIAVSVDEFIRRFDAVFERLGEVARGELAVHELIESGVLVRFEHDLQFHRTAFRDFFAAQYLFRQRSDADQFIVDHLWDKRWAQVLVFTAGLRRHNTALLSRLNAAVMTRKTQQLDSMQSDYIYGSYLLGRLLANSEASDADSRVAVLRTCLDAAHASIPEFVAVISREMGNIGELGALIGVEQTFLITVGVPWLELQFRQLASDDTLPEDERYLVAAIYASLGSDDWLTVLERAARDFRTPRVLLVLFGLTKRLARGRGLLTDERKRLTVVGKIALRGLKGKEREVRRLLQMKTRIAELEMKRLKRLSTGEG